MNPKIKNPIIRQLRKEYESICTKYLNLFALKHSLTFEFWISDEIGSIASFGDTFFFTMDNIMEDINNDYPKNIIMDWHWHCLDVDQYLKNDKDAPKKPCPNLSHYAMGAR